MNLNVLLRGQSNSIVLGQEAGAALTARIEQLLGFDGKADTVTLLFKPYDAGDKYTSVSGTSLIGDWLKPTTTNGQQGWEQQAYEKALVNYVTSLPADQRDDPTVVLWLHSEYDSGNATLTAATWEDAVRYDASLVRAAFNAGLSTSNPISYVFVEPIPLDSNGAADPGAQAIRTGMADLAADGSFGARLTAENDDLAMNGVFEGAGGHMSQADADLVAERAARSIAEAFGVYAKDGSPVKLGGGNIDDTGPVAVQAQRSAAGQVTVTLKFDGAASLQALDADAATGIGWQAIAGSTVLKATGVALGAGNTLVVSFGTDLPVGAKIYYGYGDTHLLGTSGPATGNAIYDDQGMPLRTPVAGLVIDGAVVQPGVTVPGTDGADNLAAGTGGDTVIGGKGDDVLTAGAGADTFVFSLGDGNDTVFDFKPGVDKISFGAGITDADIQIFPFSQDGLEGLGILYGPNGDGIVLAGVTALGPNDLAFAPPPVQPPTLRQGTTGDDNLAAGGGGDTLVGGQGNDFLAAGAGADEFRFSLGDGNDWIDGFKPGTDHIVFGPGITADLVRIEALNLGVDGLAIYYGTGTDAVFLAGVTALGANDITYGAPVVQPPTLRQGTAGDDNLAAGGGGDTLVGGQGNDFLAAGAGADEFRFSLGDGNDWIDGFKSGTDHIVFGPGITADLVRVEALNLGVDGLAVYYGTGTDAVFLAGVTALGANDITYGAPVVQPPTLRQGTTGDDNLAAGGGGDTLVGGQGNDTMAAGAGADEFRFSLGDGNDWVDGFKPGTDHIVFGPGITADLVRIEPLNLGVDGLAVYYGTGTDAVFLAGVTALGANDITYGAPVVQPPTLRQGTTGDDTLAAGGGGDTLVGGQGNDIMAAGAGADEFRFSLGDGNDWIDGFKPGTDHIVFGPGITADLVRVEPLKLGVDGLAVYYGTGTDAVFLAGVTALGANDITYDAPVVQPPTLRQGTTGDDTLAAGNGGDTLVGGQGNDTMAAGAGADEFRFSLGDGTDRIDGFKSGTDHIVFGPGITADLVRMEATTLSGTAGLAVHYGTGTDAVFLAGVTALGANDITYGAPVVQPPTLRQGTTGDDTLAAGNGGDTLVGGQGNDTMAASAGADEFRFSLGDGTDRIDGFKSGTDHIVFGPGITADLVRMEAATLSGTAGLAVHYGNGTDSIFLAGVTALGANDVTYGAPVVQPPTLRQGTTGDDTLAAGNGGDTLVGGQGNDTMAAGAGADEFRFSLGDGTDRIDGFKSGTDHIVFGPGITADLVRMEAATLSGTAGLAVHYGNGTDSIFLAGVTALGANDVTYGAPVVQPPTLRQGTTGDDTLAAGNGGDTLVGGQGNDTMAAGAGADEFRFSLGDGTDRIDGFKSGTDHIVFGPGITADLVRMEAATLSGTAGLAVHYGTGTDAVFLAGVTALGANDVTYGAAVTPPDTGSGGTGGGTGGGGTGGGSTGGDTPGGGQGGGDPVGSGGGDGPSQPPATLPNFAVTSGGVTTQVQAVAYAGTLAGLQYQYTGTDAAETVTGTTGHDLISLGGGDDQASGGAGNDRLEGGAGRDVAVFSGTSAQTVLLHNADGSWTATGPDGTDTLFGFEVARFSDGDRALHTVIRDFTGTGTSDILLRGADGSVEQWQMDGVAHVGGGALQSPGAGWKVAATGDFDGDGRADILWRQDDGLAAINRMDGTQVLGGGVFGFAAPSWSVVGTGDFNGDGHADILWRDAGGGIAQWWMNGTTYIGGDGFGIVDPAWRVAAIADFNGDGKSDLAWQHANGTISIWLMDGINYAGGGVVGYPGANWQVVGAADFNADGKADLLLRDMQGGGVAEWWMDGATLAGGDGFAVLDQSWQVAGVADYDGNGKADILWRHDSGALSIWQMDGLHGTASYLGTTGPAWTVI
ncbi:FG-GAP-like repeat-containing protein [Paracraurococcus lichenis]|uniref:FG-GAP-like repeat-containing protein n=1 Tax=Paracraurococcus lichenis TaxID=3064888 RepID=A0ABT9E8B9_9PROT|nr:FG-GAP-like repeat-containing protein [Paracraurococcus sp. LOR1-02]MDO9712310.1 FG-GAP-like repeat-containing protein [Paracraurococcus sp. LOR1-02]